MRLKYVRFAMVCQTRGAGRLNVRVKLSSPKALPQSGASEPELPDRRKEQGLRQKSFVVSSWFAVMRLGGALDLFEFSLLALTVMITMCVFGESAGATETILSMLLPPAVLGHKGSEPADPRSHGNPGAG